ncbi:MAG: hypothetical protein NT155_04080 [Candidatus Staskawiczbacteria bacterium]|nr:hypothetical protein [Candidatus Staskawiczbacteria bacterium]
MSKYFVEIPKPAEEAPVAGSVDDIKKRLQEIVSATQAKEEAGKQEELEIIKEVADMAEGNKCWSKRKATSKMGSGYEEIEGKGDVKVAGAQRSAEELDNKYRSAEDEIAGLRLKIVEQEKGAREEDKPQYKKLLEELEAQSAQLKASYAGERPAVQEKLGSEYKKKEKRGERHSKFKKEQQDADQDHYKFATETVIAAHRDLAEPGKAKDYSAKRNEIYARAQEIGSERQAFESAQERLPEMEKYMDYVEREFALIKAQLPEKFEEAKAQIAAFRAAEIENSDVVERVAQLKKDLKKSANPGWLTNKAKARQAHRKAEDSLAEVKSELKQKIGRGDVANDFGNFSNEIIIRLQNRNAFRSQEDNPKDLSESAFDAKAGAYNLASWLGYAERNEKLFAPVKEKISALLKRIESIKQERVGIYQEAIRVRDEIYRKKDDLRVSVESLCNPVEY